VGSENLAYALTQVVHNFGAVAVVGGAVFVLWPSPRLEYGRAFAWLILLGWSAQIASGAMFGATSLYYYGETPDLSGIATAALAVKVAAAVSGGLARCPLSAPQRDMGPRGHEARLPQPHHAGRGGADGGRLPALVFVSGKSPDYAAASRLTAGRSAILP
jgi:hypothetical protein